MNFTPGVEFSADELAGGRGVAAGAERRGHEEGDPVHGRRGRQYGGRYEVDEFGAGWSAIRLFIGQLAVVQGGYDKLYRSHFFFVQYVVSYFFLT